MGGLGRSLEFFARKELCKPPLSAVSQLGIVLFLTAVLLKEMVLVAIPSTSTAKQIHVTSMNAAFAVER